MTLDFLLLVCADCTHNAPFRACMMMAPFPQFHLGGNKNSGGCTQPLLRPLLQVRGGGGKTLLVFNKMTSRAAESQSDDVETTQLVNRVSSCRSATTETAKSLRVITGDGACHTTIAAVASTIVGLRQDLSSITTSHHGRFSSIQSFRIFAQRIP